MDEEQQRRPRPTFNGQPPDPRLPADDDDDFDPYAGDRARRFDEPRSGGPGRFGFRRRWMRPEEAPDEAASDWSDFDDDDDALHRADEPRQTRPSHEDEPPDEDEWDDEIGPFAPRARQAPRFDGPDFDEPLRPEPPRRADIERELPRRAVPQRRGREASSARPDPRGRPREEPRDRPRPEAPPMFAPVFTDEDGGSRRTAWGFEGDSGLLRVVGVIVGLAIVIAVLVLPPVSLLDRGGEGGETGLGIQTSARDDLPAMPAGLVALSALYDLTVPEGVSGPVALTVRLRETPTDPANLGFYTYAGDRWSRLGPVSATSSGDSAAGEVDVIPSNIAVLERVAAARGLAMIVDAGETPDPDAPRPQELSVLAARPLADTGSAALDLRGGAVSEVADAADLVYLGVSAPEGPLADAVDAILGTAGQLEAHVDALVTAAEQEQAAGVHIDYAVIDPSRRDAFTRFVQALDTRLAEAGRRLVVSVPALSAGDVGASGHDWVALSASADALWLRTPLDGSRYYADTEATLQAQQAAGVDLGRVWLVADRRSYESTPEGVQPLSLRDALATASALRTRLDVGIAPGDAVSVAGTNLDRDAGNSGLHWDDEARAVTFSYAARGGPRTVWIENRYSLAFRLELAQRYGLGGVAVSAAHESEALPDVWSMVAAYVEEGRVDLERPYGPYLEPEWLASDGLIEGGSDGVVVWRAPDRVGVYDITLVVSEGTVFVGQQISLRVTEDGTQPEPDPNAGDDADDADDAVGEEEPSPTEDDTTDDGSTDDGATDDGTTDDGSTDDGTTDGGTTDDGSTDGGTTDDGASDDGSTDDGTAAGGGQDAEPDPDPTEPAGGGADPSPTAPPGPAGNE